MRDIFKCIPGRHTMEVIDFQVGDARFEVVRSDGVVSPLGVSLARLREQFGGEEGTMTGPDGEQYQLSLAPWSAANPDTTYLRMSYRFTPDQPARIDPALQPARPDPKHVPASVPTPSASSTSSTTTLTLSSQIITQGDRVVRPRMMMRFDVFGDVRGNHRLTIYPDTEQAGIPVAALLAMPEMQIKEVQCPVCESKVTMRITLAERIQEFVSRDSSITHIRLAMSHLADLPETKTLPEHSPITVEKFRRYAAVTEPSRIEIPGVEQYIAVKSHEHLVTIRPISTGSEGSTTAATLLQLPEAKQSTITCPLCDTVLQFTEPLERFISMFVGNMGADAAQIEWRIAHPESIPVTKTPPENAPIRVTRGEELNENEGKLQDGYPVFFVVPASGA